ncbi:AAA family ATPase [Paenibacillus tepidiphilus]|uniref:AAA family ATPase n=1 Tax=Paenibacillus tepidiphilus TaxID=2608683 RepID=UPI00123B85EA|nr:AAA family ATPase [Paenibacillus tepidiphilus]
MNRFVFFLGPAGAGKTTLAKAVAARRPAAILDMDILLRPAADAIMTMHGLDPTDRDSAEYKALCRDLGYRITMDAALDNIGLASDMYIVGPFTKEAADPEWIGRELSRRGLTLSDIEVKVLLVGLGNEELYRERILQRKSPLDDWKFRNWEQFRSAFADREMNWPLPPDHILRFDNSSSDLAGAADQVEHFIYGDPLNIHL